MNEKLKLWHKKSSEEYGMNDVIVPYRDETEVLGVSRLNAKGGEKYDLYFEKEEINALIVSGDIVVFVDNNKYELQKLDSFYAPSKTKIIIEFKNDAVLYIGKAPCEGVGKPFVRKMDFSLPIGDIHQIHGEGSGQREVILISDVKDILDPNWDKDIVDLLIEHFK